MKTIMIIATSIVVAAGVAYAGMKCNKCSGSGWDGQFKCLRCGGDGEVGN